MVQFARSQLNIYTILVMDVGPSSSLYCMKTTVHHVDHSFPSVVHVYPFVKPTKYALFSFIIQLIVYTL